MTDLARIEAFWRSPANGLTDLEHASTTRQFSRVLSRRKLLTRAAMGFAALMLVAGFLVFSYGTITGQLSIDWQREWAIALLFVVSCVTLALACGSHVALTRPRNTGSPVLASLQALLDENASGRLRLKIVAAAYCLLVPLLVWGIGQLGAVGKMQPAHQQQASIALGLMLVVSASLMAARFFAYLKPEQRRLEALIRQYAIQQPDGG